MGMLRLVYLVFVPRGYAAILELVTTLVCRYFRYCVWVTENGYGVRRGH